jgi:hydroxyacylglutathione hydrolase
VPEGPAAPDDAGMEVKVFPGGGFGENAYLVWTSSGGDAVVVDPGAGTSDLMDFLRSSDLVVRAILLTHAHLDHVDGVAALKKFTSAPVYLHPAARPHYDAVEFQAAAFGVELAPPPPPDIDLVGGETLRFGALVLQVLDAPGHAPGHVIFHAPDAAVAFVGDVIFSGSIGRTDLPGGDFRTLMTSIRSVVLSLPDQTRLYPGHGPETTVGHERRFNPFLVSVTGGELA